MADPDEVLRTALRLEFRDRARLAEKLLASLDALSEEEAERLWADEAERRLEEYRAGRTRAISADDVAQRAQKVYVSPSASSIRRRRRSWGHGRRGLR